MAGEYGNCRLMSIALVDLGEARAQPADRRQAAYVAAILIVCCLFTVPLIALPLGVSYPIFAIVIALSIAAIAITAVGLWAQAQVTHSLPLAVLALGYALTALSMLPYMLFWRGLWPRLSDWISADPQTSSWLYVEWHTIFICSTLGYFIVRKQQADAPPRSALSFEKLQRRLVWIGVVIIVLTVPPLIWIDGLPALSINGRSTALYSAIVNALSLGALVSIGIAYWMNRFSTLLNLWLSFACLAMIADMTLTRYSRPFATGWYASQVCTVVAATVVLFVLLFQTANIYGQLAATAERLRNESLTDVLTGLVNRRGFDQRFAEVLRECARERRPVSLLMIDVDHFKSYNDTFGHQAGDKCLRVIAMILQHNVGRVRDLVARVGGEEMAVLIPEVDLPGAMIVADRMRAAVQAAAVAPGAGAVHPFVTISIGVIATRDPGATPAGDLIAAADSALYRAKAAGRNRVSE